MLVILSGLAYADFQPYTEDFESYKTGAVYSDSQVTYTVTCSEHPELGEATMSNSFIMNAPGGMYSDDSAYTANAAENVCTYAKTGDTTLNAVFGGLNNGWHGRYSAAMTELSGRGGVDAGFNQYNRRLAVVDFSGGKVLRINPAKNSYIDTYSTYGNDSVELTDNTLWSTDFYVSSVASNASFEIALSKGSFSEPQYLQLGGLNQGRTALKPLVSVDGELNVILFGDEAAGSISKNTWYTAEILFRLDGENAVCNIRIKNTSTGEVAASYDREITDYNFSSKIAGFDYHATSTTATSGESNVLIDNISIRSMDLTAKLVSTRPVALTNAKTAIDFSSDVNPETLSSDTIRVFCGKEILDGITFTRSGNRRVIISLPELKATSTYRIDTTGVEDVNGIMSKSSVTFKTGDLISVSGAKKTEGGVGFKITNNSGKIESVVAAVVCEGGAVINGFFYRLVSLEAKQTEEILFDGISDIASDAVYIYILSDINNPQLVLADSVKL